MHLESPDLVDSGGRSISAKLVHEPLHAWEPGWIQQIEQAKQLLHIVLHGSACRHIRCVYPRKEVTRGGTTAQPCS